MSLQKILSSSIACPLFFLIEVVSLNSAVLAQDLSKTVLPITEFKLKLKKKSLPSSMGWTALVPKIAPAIEEDYGTGFCIDPECRLIGTNYHVAAFARPRKIKGQEVIQRYLATGPDDEGATLNDYLSDRPLKYTLNRDLAIFELRHPLPHHHGIAFSLDDLELDDQVDIYAYPANSINPIRKLVQFHGAYKGKTTVGFLAFEYEGKPIHGGSSGGLVVDSKTHEVVGILGRVGLGKNGKQVALAVPVQSLADLVNKVQPWLAESLFPSANKESISPTSADLYPKFVPPPPSGLFQHRPDEPPEVALLRRKAQTLADSMRNFIAVQSFEWGSGHKEPAAHTEYEVRVIDDYQQFRELPDGKKELQTPANPRVNGFVVPADEWSRLPRMVGTDFRLKVNHAGSVIVSGRQIKVFQYYASVEDDLCEFAPIEDFLLFTLNKIVATACYGEVWTDSDTNIIRISKHLDLSQRLKAFRGWDEVQVVLTYGWLRRRGEPPRLVPLTISTEAGYKKHTFWCQGTFTNYRIFTSRAEIINASNNRVQSPLP